MSPVNLQLVREFFELHTFRVLTNWQHDTPRASEATVQLFVENGQPEPERPLDTLLRLEDIPMIQRAVVDVRAWHGDRFYASVVENNPILTQFAQQASKEQAAAIFGADAGIKTVLVLSELPAAPEQRARTLAKFAESPVDHVIEFPTILHGLLEKVSAGGDYGASPTLATLRLLKRYRMVRNMQLEFMFRGERIARAAPGVIDASVPEPGELPDDED